MNSHDRRITERRWPYYVDINDDDELLKECAEWLWDNFGSCRFKSKANPRWCARINYATVGFGRYAIGAQIYFRKEKDYAWFLLKWDR